MSEHEHPPTTSAGDLTEPLHKSVQELDRRCLAGLELTFARCVRDFSIGVLPGIGWRLESPQMRITQLAVASFLRRHCRRSNACRSPESIKGYHDHKSGHSVLPVILGPVAPGYGGGTDWPLGGGP